VDTKRPRKEFSVWVREVALSLPTPVNVQIPSPGMTGLMTVSWTEPLT